MSPRRSRLADKDAQFKMNFLISQPKHMLCILKRTISTNVKMEGIRKYSQFYAQKVCSSWTNLHSYEYVCLIGRLVKCNLNKMSRGMKFQTMWHFDMDRLRQACAASF